MHSPIYITKAGEQFGPFPSDQITALIENGHFAWDDLAWRDGFEQWAPLHQIYQDLAGEVLSKSVRLVEDEEKPASFLNELLMAFVYPFRGDGAWVILLFGILLAVIFAIIRFAMLFGVAASILLTGYCIAFLFKIIMETATGEQDVAELPGLQNMWDDMLRPFFQVVFAVLTCLLPYILAAWHLEDGPSELSWLPFVLLAGGLFYLPMVLMAMVIFNSLLTALNPILVFPAISRIFLRYLVVVIILGAILIGYGIAAEALDQSLHWFVAYPVVTLVTFYTGIIQARILGLIYRTNAERIGWFNH